MLLHTKDIYERDIHFEIEKEIHNIFFSSHNRDNDMHNWSCIMEII